MKIFVIIETDSDDFGQNRNINLAYFSTEAKAKEALLQKLKKYPKLPPENYDIVPIELDVLPNHW